jgi:hypothetical protein
MSELRFEKIRVPAELRLTLGPPVAGTFFVAGSAFDHDGPERVGDLLNARKGFFPFQRTDGQTAQYNRAQVIVVTLGEGIREAEADPGYAVAPRRRVAMLLSNGDRLTGTVPIYRPPGRDRLSDYAQTSEPFRYLVTPERTLLVNASHIVELSETAD